MSQKVRKTLIMIVMAALIICLMAASLTYTFTYGRYTGKDFDAEKSPYDDLIEFVGANQYLVYSPEELIQAIKDGYSNIQIADEAEQPFVITEGVTDVTANLVLDVNGKTLIRNSRNPMLDVQTNVSVVLVYDSSDDKQGGFYNPVGSALQASGGTLTVGSGNYDDGPKGTYSTSDISQSTSATLVTRTDRTETSYGTPTKGVADLPKIDKNHYFSEDASTGSFNATYIKPDTFLILTYEDDCMLDASDNLITGVQTEGDAQTGKALTVPCNAASCDFYYYYEVGDNPTTSGEKETDTYAVVYGYNDVKALARDDLPEGQTGGDGMATALKDSGLIWPYAAVRMVEGEGIVRGGTFSNHFDVAKSYGIYAEGGTLSVSKNTTVDTTFTTGGEGVCIRVQSATGETTTTGEATTTGGSLTISGGEFSSEIGNTIEMSGGKMNVTAGTFIKDASVEGAASGEGANNGSAIDIQGGTLNSSESESTEERKPIQFEISGSYVNGIHAAGGEVNIANAFFNFLDGNNNRGIFNNGGTSRAHWCDFTIPGDNNYGIHSTNGTTRASDCAIKMTGEYAVGVYTTGGRALVEGGGIDVTFAENKSDGPLTSAAVSTEGGEIYLAGSLKIESDSLGVTVRKVEETEGSLEIADQEIKIENTTYQVDKGNVSINTPNATAIYINNGSLTNKGTVTVTSCVGEEDGTDNGWSWVDENGNAIDFNKYNGVYVQGGSLDSTGALNVTFTGVQNDAYGSGDNSGLTNQTAYYLFKTKSYAVRVEGSGDTTVRIASGNITNAVGGGVLVNGGKVTLGREGEGAYTADENGNSSGLTVETTGYGLEYTDRVLVNDDSFESWIYRCTTTGGDAVKIDGGTLKILGGQYQTAHGNGIFVRGAQAAEEDAYAVEISGGAFRGYNSSEYGENADLTGPAQSYGIKIIGGKVLVNGGTFGSSNVTRTNGSAFFMGLPDEEAEIKIQRGNFYSKNTDAVATFRYTDITFEDLSDNNQNINISVTADRDRAAVALQDDQLFSQGDRSSTVTINGGTYTANGFGVWYGCSQDKLDIQKGIFTGSNISGLYFNVHPTSNGVNHVTLSGGTYYGKDNSLYGTETWIFAWVITSVGNYTTNNAIAGNANLDSVLDAGYHAYGDTEFDPNSSVSGLDNVSYNCEDSTHGVAFGGFWYQLNNINSKGEIRLTRVQSTELVYSCIVISQNTPATP